MRTWMAVAVQSRYCKIGILFLLRVCVPVSKCIRTMKMKFIVSGCYSQRTGNAMLSVCVHI